jgi:DNA end-binding protein Ku
MLFEDEVRPASAVPTGGKKPSKKEVDQAVALIEELSTDWKPDRYEDCYRERLRRVIDDKRKRRKIEAPEPERQPAATPDLMAALEATLANARAGRPIREAPSSNGDELDSLSKEELAERAKKAGVKGRTKMSKKELVDALSD